MRDVFLSVVIPCYDEMANLQKGVLEKVIGFLKKKHFVFEVIISDDGSKDGSVEFVESFAKEHSEVVLLKNSHMGKAGAVTAGMLKAKGKYVVFADMDQATPIEEIDKLLPFLTDNKADIAIGSRTYNNMGYPFSRLIMHEGMISLRKLIVGLSQLHDTQCGFKMFTHDASQKLFKKMYELHSGFFHISGSAVTAGFDVELLLLAEVAGYEIKEVPVHWLYVETRRVNPIKDSVDAVVYLLKIRMNKMQGKYTIV
ncbi:MAG: glycosyltransferase [Patescibacteria group bacterium]|nr:glycosyltransferase [Patescibacteria group bacterium]